VACRRNPFSAPAWLLGFGVFVVSAATAAQQAPEKSSGDVPLSQPPPDAPAPDGSNAVDLPPPGEPGSVPKGPVGPPPWHPPASSPEIQLENAIASAPAIGYRAVDVGSKVSERFVMPSGYAEVGGELAFITSGAVVTPKKLAFGDLALFRPTARRSFSDKLELSLGTTLLAKEPSGGHDWIWQGASLGALYEPSPGYGLTLGGAAGPLRGGNGSFWSAAPGVTRKWTLDRDARAVLGLSDAFTALDPHGELGARAWLDEVVLSGEVELGHSEGAGWVGVNYAVPVAKHGEQPLAPGLLLRPTTRLDVEVGGVWRVGEHESWDLFAYYAWIDRGEASRPSTLLPVLDGGFDQQQVVLGVRHRFEPKREAVKMPDGARLTY